MMEGLGIVLLIYYFAIFLAMVGGVLLIVSVFAIRLRKTSGKIVFILGLLCFVPYTSFLMTEIKNKRAGWNALGPMLQAIDRDRYQKVVRMIRDGYDVNEDRLDDTPLTYAIKKGNIRIVRLLVENGAGLNTSATYGYFPLEAAVYYRDTAITTYLLDNGADISFPGRDGITPIQKAAVTVPLNKDVIEILIRRGANVNDTLAGNITPLHGAIMYKEYGIVRLLLEHGADPSCKAGQMGTALELAEIMNDQDMVHLLLQYKTQDKKD